MQVLHTKTSMAVKMEIPFILLFLFLDNNNMGIWRKIITGWQRAN